MPIATDPVADPEVIRQTAAEVLQGDDYRTTTPANFDAFWKLLNGILEYFIGLLEALYDLSPFLYYAFTTFLVILLIGLIWHIGYSLKTAMSKRRRPEEYDMAESADENTPEAWENRARQAYGEHDYLSAVRYLLFAGLLRLELARKGHVRRGATNREYLRRYRNTAAYEPLAMLVEITDSRWYGGITCTADDVEQCLDALRHLERAVQSGGNHAVGA